MNASALLALRFVPRRASSAHGHRRLPRWLERGLRACARAARWWLGEPHRAPRVGADPVLDGTLLDESSEPAEKDLRERRCGWFDSSQDLREGLCVSEHDERDSVCAQLPVMAWVQLQLSGWRPDLEVALPSLR